MKRLLSTQTGSVLLPFVIILPFFILMIVSYMELTVSSFKVARRDQSRTHAQFSADAGVDVAMAEISENAAWASTGGEITLQNSNGVRSTYQVTVTDVDADNKTITAVGRAYRPASASTAEASVTLNIGLRAVKSGEFSIVSGVGGLFLSNSAKIVGGDVRVNGEISLKNSAQIGLTTNPVSVEVAHQTCPEPANASYPQLCGPGNGEPITIENTARIYGEVKANNQTNGASMSNPGLTASSGIAAQALPPHDRDAQEAAVATTITGSSTSCAGNQTRTWTANTKITGNVTISGSCVVTVNGNVWITGNLTVQNSGQIKVANSLGATRPNLMIDGSAGASLKNTAKLVSNTDSTGFQIITYYSRASCSPDCANVTGTDLYNTRNDTTISLDNSAEGPQTIFYARWSRVQVNNSGQIGALVGQTVELKNSGTITFGTSVPGSGNTFWVIDSYRRSF
jgi:hypothetical protein